MFFHWKVDKSDNNKDEEEGDVYSSNEETNNEDSRNLDELGNQNKNMTLYVATMTGISQPQTLKVYGYGTMSCDVKCHKVKLSMNEYKLKYLMYPMPIEGVDIVLGAQWLAMHGTIGLNLQEQFIRFYQNGENYKLHGINCPPPQIVSSNRMEKIIKEGAQAYLLHWYAIERTTNEDTNVDPNNLEKILGKFNTIFQDLPHGIPPPCSRYHMIELIPGSTPIRKKYFKQSHQHKTKIEHLVQELLELGVITWRNSHFLVLVILVRKNDRSYRLCIDYRALKKNTIKDKFSIPIPWC